MAPSAAVLALGSGKQRGGGKVERLGDRAQHARRRVSGAAFDLRQIALGGFGSVRQLPARHAALGAIAPNLASDGGEERGRRRSAALRGGSRLLTSLCLGNGLGHHAAHSMHYNA